jgi:PIN domain nuclease of toxin-antitoxin system
MTDVVLDASAILAVIFDEPGTDRVAAHLPGALASTVNVAEVATRLFALQMPEDTVETIIDTLQLAIQPFDYAQALETARLRSATRAQGLSLGDRACLALAKTQRVPALTTDRVWQDIADAVQVSVDLVRY